MYILLVLLFVVLTPGILVKLPTKGSKFLVAATHAVLFAVAVYILRQYQYEGFQNSGPPMPPMPPMPPGPPPPMPPMPPPPMPPMPPTSGSASQSITFTKEDISQLKEKLIPTLKSLSITQKIMPMLM